jgi:hypothetical protein
VIHWTVNVWRTALYLRSPDEAADFILGALDLRHDAKTRAELATALVAYARNDFRQKTSREPSR